MSQPSAELPNFVEAKSPEEFKKLLSADLNRVSLINFWAEWAEPCRPMNTVVQELARKYKSVLVIQVDAEKQEDIAESFDIQSVPTCLILRGHVLLSRIDGADAAKLTADLAQHTKPTAASALSSTNKSPQAPSYTSMPRETPEQLTARMQALMGQSPVVLFMKGSPDTPRCGFSRSTVALLREKGVSFTHFDILSDEAVRQGLKKLNNWPTFPQVIVNGEFVGGLDVLREMDATGELDEVFGAAGKAEA